MKKLKIFLLTCICLCFCAIGGLTFIACSDSGKEENNMCTITYNFNLGNSVGSEMNNQLLSAFDKEGFSKKVGKIKDGKMILTYTKQINKGDYFKPYEFDDVGLADYFEGWCVGEIKLNGLNQIQSDLEVKAKWRGDNITSKLTYGLMDNVEYTFNDANLTATFVNADVNNHHNGIGVVRLPELVINQNKFYKVTDIAYSATREDMVFCVPETYNGRLSEAIIFPNTDVNDVNKTYLGNYISIRTAAATYIYEVNYINNTAKLKEVNNGFELSEYNYAVLNGVISITRQGEQERKLEVVESGMIWPASQCVCTQFIIKKSLEDYPTFVNVLTNNNGEPVKVLFEATKDEVAEIDSTWIETENHTRSAEDIYYYSETEPAEDGYKYWHYYDNDGSTILIWD